MRSFTMGWSATFLCIAMSVAFHGAAGAEPSVDSDIIKLSSPRRSHGMSVEEALGQRRSVRKYAARAVTLEEVSQLLWAAQGITASWGGRTTPSAGALYPLEVYLAAGKVNGLGPGLYHYAPKAHALRRVRDEDVRSKLCKAALNQHCVRDAPLVTVVAAVRQRTARKYGDRAERYVDIEVGSACQNIYLQCESLDLGTVAVGAFKDSDVRLILGEAPVPLLLMPVGAKAEKGE